MVQQTEAIKLQPRFALHQQNNGVHTQIQPPLPRQRPQQATIPGPDAAASEWGDKNSWFGSDNEMTSFALGVHQTLVNEGVAPNTREYYDRIDDRMQSVFPAKFQGAGNRQRPHSTVVVADGRTPRSKKVVLTRSQVAIAKKLGVSPEAYAKEVLKQQENR